MIMLVVWVVVVGVFMVGRMGDVGVVDCLSWGKKRLKVKLIVLEV